MDQKIGFINWEISPICCNLYKMVVVFNNGKIGDKKKDFSFIKFVICLHSFQQVSLLKRKNRLLFSFSLCKLTLIHLLAQYWIFCSFNMFLMIIIPGADFSLKIFHLSSWTTFSLFKLLKFKYQQFEPVYLIPNFIRIF